MGEKVSDCDTCLYRNTSDVRAIFIDKPDFAPLCRLDLHPLYCRRNIREETIDYVEEEKKEYDFYSGYKYTEEYRIVKEFEANCVRSQNEDNAKAKEEIKNNPTRITSLIVDDLRVLYYDPECIYFILQCVRSSSDQNEDIQTTITKILEHYHLREYLYNDYPRYVRKGHFCNDRFRIRYSVIVSHIHDLEKELAMPCPTDISDLAKKVYADFVYDSESMRRGFNYGIDYQEYKFSQSDSDLLNKLIEDIISGISYTDFVDRTNQLSLVNKQEVKKEGLFKRLFRGRK